MVDSERNYLYELYNVYYNPTQGRWYGGSGAFFDMNTNDRRPSGWTSADAAGLAILPGLVRYDEVVAGHIDHAIRVTVNATDARFIWPARHKAGTANANLPPMVLRLRLKPGVNISKLSPANQL